MLLRIAVCDDEAIHRLIIRDKLDAYAISNDIDYELDEFTNSKELMKMENIYDILFLDVQLEDGMNGIEVGKRLLQKGIDATIIITTSFEQYASEGYHLKAHRYLIKPIQQSNFNEAIVSCIKDFKKSNRKIEVKCAYENCFISINSIVYIESYHRKRMIHTKEQVYETGASLQELLEQLPTAQFEMPQKSYIVNLDCVTSLTKTKVMLDHTIEIKDDEAIHRLIIRDKLDKFAISNDVDYELDEFCTSEELLKIKNIYDILFLDVQLENGVNSIEIGKQLVKDGLDATIILTTSFEQYAAEGYHLHAHRYLVKPIAQEKFNEAILSCIQEFKKLNRKIAVKCAYENCFISINKIIYIESYQRKRIIYTKEQVYETGASLNDLLSLLPVEQFEMPQKSYIVNFDHVTSITKTKVILDYSTEIKLARDRMTNFNMKFQKYIRG